MAWANISLPVPLSPSMMTRVSKAAAFLASSLAISMPWECPLMSSRKKVLLASARESLTARRLMSEDTVKVQTSSAPASLLSLILYLLKRASRELWGFRLLKMLTRVSRLNLRPL